MGSGTGFWARRSAGLTLLPSPHHSLESSVTWCSYSYVFSTTRYSILYCAHCLKSFWPSVVFLRQNMTWTRRSESTAIKLRCAIVSYAAHFYSYLSISSFSSIRARCCQASSLPPLRLLFACLLLSCPVASAVLLLSIPSSATYLVVPRYVRLYPVVTLVSMLNVTSRAWIIHPASSSEAVVGSG